jgi:hypothetical protein
MSGRLARATAVRRETLLRPSVTFVRREPLPAFARVNELAVLHESDAVNGPDVVVLHVIDALVSH